MITVSLYNQQGKEINKLELPADVFGLKINADVVAQALSAQLASARQPLAHTKDRSEVRGGGKKPWKQKGTGRSRHGSIRSPLWVGGGVTFGPRKEKNFSQKINKKMKRQAVLMALSGKLNDGEIIFLDDLKLSEPKTKAVALIINQISAAVKKELNKGTLIVSSEKNENILRAVKNLKKISMIGAANLNIADLLSARYLLMPQSAVEIVRQIFVKR